MTADTPENVTVELSAGAVHLTIDGALYPLEAVYGASYVFLDRCYVFLHRPSEHVIRATLQTRAAEPGEAALRALVGEFANELLSCAWRAQITAQNRAIIESVTAQALAGAMGPPSLDDLADFDFSDDGFEDPLGIAQSWEEKHGRAAPKAPAQAAPATPADGEEAEG